MEDKDPQFCPIAQAADIVTESWTPLILREALMGSHRFNEFKRAIPQISPSTLSRRLTTLTEAGILEKSSSRDDARGLEYHLTEAGEELRPVIIELGKWGIRWVRRKANLGKHDAAAMMWDMKRCVDAEVLPDERFVVKIEIRGVEKRARDWWLLFEEDGNTDLCLQPPGHDVALKVVATMETWADVWLGHRPIHEAIDGGDMRLEGDRLLQDSIEDWIGLSVLAPTPRP